MDTWQCKLSVMIEAQSTGEAEEGLPGKAEAGKHLCFCKENDSVVLETIPKRHE